MKTTLYSLMITISLLSVVPFGMRKLVTQTPLSQQESLPEAYTSLLPEGSVVPANLPATINDPLLLTAWVYIYNQQEAIEIHDGLKVSGRSLAELVFTYRIPVQWGSKDICGGTSCARRTLCADAACVKKYQELDRDPIYIDPKFQEPTSKVFPWLVKTLAHELYHAMLPFGSVPTSLYEEYWAFFVGTQISKAGWMEFAQYNPLKAACLQRWFQVYGLKKYAQVGPYPFTLTTEVDLTSETCTAN